MYLTKVGVAAAAIASVAAAMGLARVSYAGHHKRTPQALVVPPSMYEIVRRNIDSNPAYLAPATAPADWATSTS